ncbi:putative uncharacterized protein [Waddlia chondrophila 2032/99]|uniref:SH3b domain-containing protein n=1 Tax=Waddlia chondrophila 2032/99 TaxID=765953 RepID=F8LEW5_9BACT|nr:putative uncharacterized protein [Waddlia chondrophila 2032/99]
MLKASSYLFIASTLFSAPVFSDGSPTDSECGFNKAAHHNSKAFTGRVSRDRVRLRLSASTDSPIIKELNRGDMFLVTGEEDDFYAIKPLNGTKAYVYRTYILDGVVEGNKVNVRIEPHLEAPVIGQLNMGERIKGKISDKNSKWLEIDPPEMTRFYVSADFVEKIGDADYLAHFEKRENDVNNLLNGTYLISQQELQKPFSEIQPEKVVKNYQKIIEEYTEFPREVKQAKDSLAKFQETYLHKKVNYLEDKASKADTDWKHRGQSETAMQDHQQPSANSSQADTSQVYKKWVHEQAASDVNARMALWIPVEIAYYEKWAKDNQNRPIQEFYKEQRGHAMALRGIVEPYDRPIRNKPGDYLLVNRGNRLPIAYIYSTQVNLQDYVGQEVSLEAVLRPNNNFAYPAYYILKAE